MGKDKPDMFAENKAIMPYGDSVAAPAIKPVNISAYKNEKVIKTNQYFKARFDEIKEEYKKLLESYEWNELVYNSDFRFKPIKGKAYHLYQREKDETLFLSLIGPDEWDKIYIGSFRLDSDDKWDKIN
tara:strand:- start:2886 stop:3269 length:384 start_codon:yes stop_codon:yes gene_type:complete